MRKQHYEHELVISSQAVNILGIVELSQQISQINKKQSKCINIIREKDSHQQQKYLSEIDLQFALICNNGLKGSQKFQNNGKFIWLAIVSNQILNINYSHYNQAHKLRAIFVILSDQQQQEDCTVNSDFSLFPVQIFVVRNIQDITKIILMNQQQFERRCKFERMFKISNQNCHIKNSQEQLQQFSMKYKDKIKVIKINSLVQFMRFYSEKRKKTLKRYMNAWIVYHLNLQIQQSENKLMIEYYHNKPSQKIISKCFYGWIKLTNESSI